MKYLFFRTDRIGDFLITAPLIHAVKNKKSKSIICVVASTKNYEFIKNYKFVDEIFILKKNNIINKLKLFFQLRKYKYDAIIVSDKKNRSILLTIILKSKKKIFNVSKKFHKKILDLLFDDVFLDNDNEINYPIKKILENNCNSLNLHLKDENFHYLKKNQFINSFTHNDILLSNYENFIVFHYDEKWEIENYSKVFKKATNLTDLKVNTNLFKEFLSEFSKKKSIKIIITTGTINTKVVEDLKNILKKINDDLYEINLNGCNGYLLLKQDFFSISHLISKCSLLISCHGAFTHIASNYNVKILDIIEKSKYNHYKRITYHMKKYTYIYRDNFEELSKSIIKNS